MSEYTRGLGQSIGVLRLPVTGEVVQLRFITDGDQLVRRVVHPRTKSSAQVECKRRLSLAEEYIDPVTACEACAQGRGQQVTLCAWVYELYRTAGEVLREVFRPRLFMIRGRLSNQVMNLYYSIGSLTQREYTLSKRGTKYELLPLNIEVKSLQPPPMDLNEAVDKELRR